MPHSQVSVAAVDPDHFRQVLAHVPTPVTVVTASTPDGPVGLAIGSFVSVSLTPPLIGVFADEKSTSWPRIAGVGSFTVNVLTYDQRELCARFAARGGDKFAGLDWSPSAAGHPLLPDVAAWLDCRLVESHRFGDHLLAVGRVEALAGSGTARPLVFHRGGLRHVDLGG